MALNIRSRLSFVKSENVTVVFISDEPAERQYRPSDFRDKVIFNSMKEATENGYPATEIREHLIFQVFVPETKTFHSLDVKGRLYKALGNAKVNAGDTVGIKRNGTASSTEYEIIVKRDTDKKNLAMILALPDCPK